MTKQYRVLRHSINNNTNLKVGQFVSLDGIGECLIIGFSSQTGNPMVFSYDIQKIIGLI